MTLRNSVVLITGASSGIGKALAFELAKRNCALGLIARREQELKDLCQQLAPKLTSRAIYRTADVGSREELFAAVQQLRDELGPIDVLIANAGLGRDTRMDHKNIDEIEAMVKVNFLGVIYAIAAVIPEMIERRTGQICAISSLGSYKGIPGESAYTATKAAVNTYMEGLRIQAAPIGIAVTTVCPGFIDTPMIAKEPFPKPFLMSAEKAATKIVRALERKAKVYNFPWQTYCLLKIAQWMPDWLFRKLVQPKAAPLETKQ